MDQPKIFADAPERESPPPVPARSWQGIKEQARWLMCDADRTPVEWIMATFVAFYTATLVWDAATGFEGIGMSYLKHVMPVNMWVASGLILALLGWGGVLMRSTWMRVAAVVGAINFWSFYAFSCAVYHMHGGIGFGAFGFVGNSFTLMWYVRQWAMWLAKRERKEKASAQWGVMAGGGQ